MTSDAAILKLISFNLIPGKLIISGLFHIKPTWAITCKPFHSYLVSNAAISSNIEINQEISKNDDPD
jgi:hypothetical protein